MLIISSSIQLSDKRMASFRFGQLAPSAVISNPQVRHDIISLARSASSTSPLFPRLASHSSAACHIARFSTTILISFQYVNANNGNRESLYRLSSIDRVPLNQAYPNSFSSCSNQAFCGIGRVFRQAMSSFGSPLLNAPAAEYVINANDCTGSFVFKRSIIRV